MHAAKHTVLSVNLRALGGSALTAGAGSERPSQRGTGRGIPVTYVPGRNLIFSLSLRHAEAEARP